MDTLILSLLVTIIVWLFNLEFNSSLGHIWLRPDETGKIVFAYRSLISLLAEPFTNVFFWYPQNWDINFYTLFGIVYIFAKLLDNFTS